jgi:hypothetical protein
VPVCPARLRTENCDLRDHLDLAIANIQRLTIDDCKLRENLEAARRITHLKDRMSSSY